jgi:nicotinamidase-related amidase
MASNHALLVVDMFNRLDFPGAEDLTPGAVAIAGPIANLSKEVVTGGGTVIYCNDNLTSGIDPADYQHAMLLHGGPSATVAGPLYTGDGTLLVVKPGHSGFFRTDLEEVLGRRSI